LAILYQLKLVVRKFALQNLRLQLPYAPNSSVWRLLCGNLQQEHPERVYIRHMVVGTLQHFWGHVSGCAYNRVSSFVADDDRKSQIPYRNITGIVVQEDVGGFDVAVCNWLGRLVVKVAQG
jgi:hypothetical protein